MSCSDKEFSRLTFQAIFSPLEFLIKLCMAIFPSGKSQLNHDTLDNNFKIKLISAE